MSDALLGALLERQSPNGAFPSSVDAGGVVLEDETCFVTAQVALLLAELAERGTPGVAAALDRTLDFVERCAAPGVEGAFRFYPPGRGNPLGLVLPPDVDDTALAWLALIRGGRRTRAEARRSLPGLFSSVSARARRRGNPPFVRSTLYRTWLPAGGQPSGSENPVNLVANLNVVACLAEAGCDPEELRPTADAVAAACAASNLSRSSMRSLAPYYAHPAELEIAIARARSSGAGLSRAFESLALPGLDAEDRARGRPPDRPLYCNAHGRPIWRSESLQRARRLNDQLS